MKPASFALKARRDVLDAVDWISSDNPLAAQAFLKAMEQTAKGLGEHPFMGRERPDLVHPPFRFLPVTSFPYVIVYNPDRTPPLIVRVLHGARDLHGALEGLS